MSTEIFPLTIAILGLEKAGKTTLLRTMCGKKFEETLTTIGLNVEQIRYKGYIIQAIDLGGQQVFRDTLWSHYATLAKGIIFVFDIFDEERIREAKIWFDQVLTWVSRDAAIAFLANKIDLKKKKKNYLTIDKIINFFNLAKLSKTPDMSFRIFEVSAKTGENVELAKNWLLEKITTNVKEQMKISIISIWNKNNKLIYEHFRANKQLQALNYQLVQELKRLRENGIKETYLQLQDVKTMIAIEDEFSLLIGTQHNISVQDLKIAIRSLVEAIKKKCIPISQHINELEGIINTILLKTFQTKKGV